MIRVGGEITQPLSIPLPSFKDNLPSLPSESSFNATFLSELKQVATTTLTERLSQKLVPPDTYSQSIATIAASYPWNEATPFTPENVFRQFAVARPFAEVVSAVIGNHKLVQRLSIPNVVEGLLVASDVACNNNPKESSPTAVTVFFAQGYTDIGKAHCNFQADINGLRYRYLCLSQLALSKEEQLVHA